MSIFNFCTSVLWKNCVLGFCSWVKCSRVQNANHNTNKSYFKGTRLLYVEQRSNALLLRKERALPGTSSHFLSFILYIRFIIAHLTQDGHLPETLAAKYLWEFRYFLPLEKQYSGYHYIPLRTWGRNPQSKHSSVSVTKIQIFPVIVMNKNYKESFVNSGQERAGELWQNFWFSKVFFISELCRREHGDLWYFYHCQ